MPKCTYEAGGAIFMGIKETKDYSETLSIRHELPVRVIKNIPSKEGVLLMLSKDSGTFL